MPMHAYILATFYVYMRQGFLSLCDMVSLVKSFLRQQKMSYACDKAIVSSSR